MGIAGRIKGSLVLVAVVPLLLAAGLLQLLGPFAGPLADGELTALGAKLPKTAFLPGQLTFLAVVLVHLCVCALAVGMAQAMLRRTPRSRPFARMAAALAIVVVAGLAAAFLLLPTSAGQLAYRAYLDFYTLTGAASGFVAPVAGQVTPLALAVMLPTACGVVAVAMVSAAANAQLQLFRDVFEARGDRQPARIRQLHDRMRRCLYALSIVLVTSTVSASLFFHLPAQFAVTEKTSEAALMARMSDYASELSVFWGFTFALTLAAAVALPLALFHARLRRALEPPFPTRRRPQQTLVAEAGLLGEGREQVKFVVTLLAPLIAGPVTNLLQAASVF